MKNAPEDSVEEELRHDEQLLWTGRPRAGIRFHAADVLLIPLSLLWAGFVVYWQLMALTVGWWLLALFSALWGIPFVLMGLYLTVGRFVLSALRRRRTQYALTDRRVIMVRTGRTRRITSVILPNFPNVSLEEKRDGSGTITFGSSNGPWFPGVSWPGTGPRRPPRLEMVEGVRGLHDSILEAKDAAIHTQTIGEVTPEGYTTADKTTSALDAELGPGERLLWAGQPDGRVRLRRRDAYVFVLGLMGVGFVLEVVALVLIFGGPVHPSFPVIMAPFALIAAYLSFGRLLVDAQRRRRTHYALTDERIIVVSRLFARQVASLKLPSIEALSLTQERDGSGTLVLGPPYAWASRLPRIAWQGSTYWPWGFEMIENAKAVHDKVLESLLLAR